MKRLGLWLLALCMLLSLACAGGSANDVDDPNLGLYKATTMTYAGYELGVEDLFEEGFTIELKANSKCELVADGDKANGKWTLNGTDFTVKGGGIDCAGTLEDGVMKLQYDEDVLITLVNDAYETPSSAAQSASSGATIGSSGDTQTAGT